MKKKLNILEVEVAPYWNVNVEGTFNTESKTFVEVAPYWNVNSFLSIFSAAMFSVEVAPYWNVNLLIAFDKLSICVCRSSTILECKL